MNTIHTQFQHNSVPRRLQHSEQATTVRSVWQDNPTPRPARTATPQPAPPQNNMRPPPKDVNTTRTHQGRSKKRKTIHLTLWVKPGVKAELERIAEQEELSVSQTGAAFLEQALQQNLHTQHEALLDPIIEKAIAKHMRSYSTRIALLLVRVAFASEQTRSLVTNILGRQTGITQPILEHILNGSSNVAKRNITRKTPQLEAIIAEVEHWFTEANTAPSGSWQLSKQPTQKAAHAQKPASGISSTAKAQRE